MFTDLKFNGTAEVTIVFTATNYIVHHLGRGGGGGESISELKMQIRTLYIPSYSALTVNSCIFVSTVGLLMFLPVNTRFFGLVKKTVAYILLVNKCHVKQNNVVYRETHSTDRDLQTQTCLHKIFCL